MPNNLPPGFEVDAPPRAAKSAPKSAPSARTSLPAGFTIDEALDERQREISDKQVNEAARRDNFARQLEDQFPGQFPADPTGNTSTVDPYASQRYDAVAAPPSSNFKASLKNAFIADPATRKRELAKDVGVPESRVGDIDGRPVFVNDAGKVQGVSNSFLSGLAGLTAASPEIVGSGAGAIIGAPALLGGGPVVGSGLGGGAGRAVKRGVASLMFDEPVTPASLGKEVGIETAVSAAGAGVGKAVSAFAGRGRLLDNTLSPAQLRAAESTISRVKASTGIDLDLAQASGDRVLLGMRDFVARSPSQIARLIDAADEASAGKLDSATRNFLDSVSTAAPSEVVGRNGVNSAQMLLRATREKASKKVEPLYTEAYREVPEIKNRRFLAMLKLPYFDDAVKTATERARLKGIKYDNRPPDLRLMDYTKQALDDTIEQLKSDPASKGNRSVLEALVPRRNEFVKFLDNVSGNKYKTARDAYAAEAQRTIEPLTNGVVGVLSRVKDPVVAKAAAKVLNDPSVSPQAISFARTQLDQASPGAWNGMVRQWLGQKWAAANKPSQSGDVLNPAGKFYQSVFGEGQRERTRAMLPGGAAQAFDDLMLAMEALAKTPLGASRVAGSNTFRDTAIDRQITDSIASGTKAIARPITSLVEFVEGNGKEKAMEAFTQAIMDPAKRAQLKAITKLKPGTQRALLLGSLLSTQSGSALLGTQELLSPPPRAQAQ